MHFVDVYSAPHSQILKCASLYFFSVMLSSCLVITLFSLFSTSSQLISGMLGLPFHCKLMVWTLFHSPKGFGSDGGWNW